jgi:CRISPR/Cas system Type II protein with McrA/HNH and RuvC-like nuclease domain
MEMMTDLKILVLNADYQPINMTSFVKGYKLIYKGKAEVIVADKNNKISLFTADVARPKVIRLLKYIYLPYRKLNLSKPNIYKRDGHACVYCNSRENLTLDHVLPRSRGGGNTWENLVTCCSRCNSRKDNMTPEEAGMKLKVKPTMPTFSKLIGISKEEIFSVALGE